MARKKLPKLTNKDIIHELTKAGKVPLARYVEPHRLDKLMDFCGKAGKKEVDFKFSWFRHMVRIPVKDYEEVIGRKFASPLKIGDRVEILAGSKRKITRNGYNQDVGDNFDYKHMGIGSGRIYYSDNQILASNWYRWAGNNRNQPREGLKIGSSYALNPLGAEREARYHESQGHQYCHDYLMKYHTDENDKKIKDKTRYCDTNYWNNQSLMGGYSIRTIKAHDFVQSVTIGSEGFFGYKNKIHGYIEEVYVHFIYPNWENKREARYQLILDTGARVVLTSDYLKRSWDTDYDLDEQLHVCPESFKCTCENCDHKEPHVEDQECHEICTRHDTDCSCETVFDFTTLPDTTVGKGYIRDEEKKGK